MEFYRAPSKIKRVSKQAKESGMWKLSTAVNEKNMIFITTAEEHFTDLLRQTQM